jgi:sec-independent protein translocase protein TatA
MFGLGMRELIVILLIMLLLFGASKVPELARALGRSLQEFKKATKDAKKEIDITASEVEDEKDNKE